MTLNLEGFELLETYAVVVAECIRANTILERLVVRPSRGELISDSRSNGCGGGGGKKTDAIAEGVGRTAGSSRGE